MGFNPKVSQGHHVCVTEYAKDISLRVCREAHELCQKFLITIITTVNHAS